MTARAAALLVLVVALTGCNRLTPEEERTVQRWLLCEECTEGEQAAVVALGPRGERALSRALQTGPPKDRIQNMRMQAEAMYARIPSPGMTRQQYVDHFLGNYKATYHSRAIAGLQAFGTPTAHAALVEALRHESRYRSDVLGLLGEAAAVDVSVAEGDGQHAPLDSVVKVKPMVLVRDTLTTDSLSGVRVVFRADSGGGQALDSVGYTDANGRASTRWRLGDTDSVNVLSATAAGRTVRLSAVGHQDGPRVVFVVQPSDGTEGQPLTPPAKIVVQDAWGVRQVNLNLTADVTVLPINLHSVYNVVDGEAVLSDLSVSQPGTGFQLRVEVAGAPTAFSAPFDIAIGP
jgi:hypothetical protein